MGQTSLLPITDNTPLAQLDKDGDGLIVSSGKIPKWGAKGTRWQSKGAGVFWPEGYVGAVIADPWAWTPDAPQGAMPLLSGGASASITGWGAGSVGGQHYTRLGTAITVSKPITNLHVHDLTVEDCKRLVQQDSRLAVMKDFRFERLNLGVREIGIYARGDSNGVITDVKARMIGGPSTSQDNFPQAVQIGQKAQDKDTQDFSATVEINNLEATDFTSNWGSKYGNGGGIVIESGNHIKARNWRFVRCIEGSDCKGDLEADYLYYEENERAFKQWYNAHVVHLRSLNPHKHFPGSAGATCDILMQGISPDFLKATPGATIPVVHIENLELLGDAPRKFISGRGGALFDLVIDHCNLDPALIAQHIDYVGHGANITVNGQQLLRRTV